MTSCSPTSSKASQEQKKKKKERKEDSTFSFVFSLPPPAALLSFRDAVPRHARSPEFGPEVGRPGLRGVLVRPAQGERDGDANGRNSMLRSPFRRLLLLPITLIAALVPLFFNSTKPERRGEAHQCPTGRFQPDVRERKRVFFSILPLSTLDRRRCSLDHHQKTQPRPPTHNSFRGRPRSDDDFLVDAGVGPGSKIAAAETAEWRRSRGADAALARAEEQAADTARRREDAPISTPSPETSNAAAAAGLPAAPAPPPPPSS